MRTDLLAFCSFPFRFIGFFRSSSSELTGVELPLGALSWALLAGYPVFHFGFPRDLTSSYLNSVCPLLPQPVDGYGTLIPAWFSKGKSINQG